MGGQMQHNGLPKQAPRGNIATVEPYKHVPSGGGGDVKAVDVAAIKAAAPYPSAGCVDLDTKHGKQTNGDFAPEFGPSKSDPKYQTLPYNTKFTINVVPSGKPAKSELVDANWNEPDTTNNNLKSMTVHSTPLNLLSKSLATPLAGPKPPGADAAAKVRAYHQLTRAPPVGAPLANGTHKPVSSVAPTKPSNIYQTSSTKILPVQPQILQSSPQLTFSPPQSSSTPLGTPESNDSKAPKPALPPKPAIKPPPRQTQPSTDAEKDNSAPPPPPPSVHDSHTPVVENNLPIIKARPLTIKKQPLSEQPRLRSALPAPKVNGYHVSINRRIEMPPAFLFPETEVPPADLIGNDRSSPNGNANVVANSVLPVANGNRIVPPLEQPEGPKEDVTQDVTDDTPSAPSGIEENNKLTVSDNSDNIDNVDSVVMRVKKGNLKQSGKANLSRRVSFDPLALLLDASLEGELELVKKTATQVPNPSAANDEGITALHNAICAGHLEIVKFLVEFGCDVNAQDSDGWTPLHCAASCNNVAMVRFLVEHGACIFATTLSDHETAAEKCEEDEEGFDGCSEYLYSVQEKLGILSGGAVYAVFDYVAQQPDELSFTAGQQLTVLRKGDENEREWWWARLNDNEGYIPRNLLGLYPRVTSKTDPSAV